MNGLNIRLVQEGVSVKTSLREVCYHLVVIKSLLWLVLRIKCMRVKVFVKRYPALVFSVVSFIFGIGLTLVVIDICNRIFMGGLR